MARASVGLIARVILFLIFGVYMLWWFFLAYLVVWDLGMWSDDNDFFLFS